MSDKWLITDNLKYYQDWEGPAKFLFQQELITACSLPNKQTPEMLNALQAGVEFEAAEEFVKYIKKELNSLEVPSAFLPEALKNVNGPYATYGMLYLALKETLFKCFLLKYQLNSLKTSLGIDAKYFILHLSSLYRHFPSEFYLKNAQFSSDVTSDDKNIFHAPFIKNTIYQIFGSFLRPRAKRKTKKRVLLFTHSPFYKDRLFHSFYKLAEKSKTIELIIIHCETGIGGEKLSDAALFKKKGIGFYNYASFKTACKNYTSQIFDHLKGVIPNLVNSGMETYIYATELNFAWMKTIYQEFQPDLVMTTSLGDIGRYVADTARLQSIPSAYIEYSLFTDDAYWMEQNVQFDHKFCIGEESINLWKRRNDPSINHHLLGYLKLDEVASAAISNNVAEKLKGMKHPCTLFFASTWSGTNSGFNIEKKELVRQLILGSAQHHYNLILKKHPSENDKILEDLVENMRLPNVLLLDQNSNDLLLPLLKASDIVCCQNSSIGLEAMYYDKPFCYLSLSSNKISAFSLLQKCGYSQTFEDISQFFKEIPGMIESQSRQTQNNKSKLLYQPTESVASHLMGLLLGILKQNTPS